VKPSSDKPNKGIVHGTSSLAYIMDQFIGNFTTTLGEGFEYLK
jgi:hypothetical protein